MRFRTKTVFRPNKGYSQADANADCHTKSKRYTETLSYTPAASNAATSPHTSAGIEILIGVSAASAQGAQKRRRLQA